MRTRILALLLASIGFLMAARAETIDRTNRYSYSANAGWMDWVADTNHGAVIGQYVCSGWIYAGNVGWINLGSGSPTNSIYYQNLSSNDFGVNMDGLGNLTGYAWGANIGWINFEQTYGQPKVDLFTGRMAGNIWSANCGWISLSNAVAYLQTDTIDQGALAPDGLPIAWLLQNFGTTNVNANADPDGDGMSNQQEYLAGTDPNNAASVLRITSNTHDPLTAYSTLNWVSVPTRFYTVQEASSLTNVWADYLVQPTLGWSNTTFYDFNSTNDFFRVRAYRPLTP